MSGPKVVRIVTREEIIAICEGHLARLNAAVEEWLKVGRRNDLLTEVEIAATRARQAGLRRLLLEDRFTELQKAVPDEIHFLAADQETRLTRAAAEKAKTRSAQRQTEAAAVAVLRALERKGVSVPDDLRSALQDTAAGRADGAAAISEAFALLSAPEKTSAVSDHQRRLAEKHKDSDDRQTFKQWLAANSPGGDNAELTRLDLRLAELAVILGEAATAEFETRLRRLFSDEPPANRALLVDSLELDLVQAVARARERAALQLRLRMLAEQLSGLDRENSKQFSLSIVARIDEPSDLLLKLEHEAEAALEQAREEAAAQSRRQAVLAGLAKLGYQVSENLETAWVQNGRVVIKRTSQPGYGVELSGKIDSGRVQMRTVALRSPGSSVDSARDWDAETIFCSDVSTLQKRLGEAGGDLFIERALAIGATPLKIVADASEVRSDETEQHVPPTTKQRTIP
jgi:hypothetical protein